MKHSFPLATAFARWWQSTLRAIERKSRLEQAFAALAGALLVSQARPDLIDITWDVLSGAPPWQAQAILAPLLMASWVVYVLVARVSIRNREALMR